MLIRRETPRDEAAIRDVNDSAFATADRRTTVEAMLTDRLRADGDVVPALSLVAEIDGVVVGHVVGSRAQIDTSASVGLGPLGVLPSHQGRGVGSALMHAVLAAADALELPEVVLLGEPAYYRRFGFSRAEPLGVRPPDPGWGEYFQLRALTRWSPERQGVFRYAQAFSTL